VRVRQGRTREEVCDIVDQEVFQNVGCVLNGGLPDCPNPGQSTASTRRGWGSRPAAARCRPAQSAGDSGGGQHAGHEAIPLLHLGHVRQGG